MGKSTINGPFSIAMLVYQRVPHLQNSCCVDWMTVFLHIFSCSMPESGRSDSWQLKTVVICCSAPCPEMPNHVTTMGSQDWSNLQLMWDPPNAINNFHLGMLYAIYTYLYHPFVIRTIEDGPQDWTQTWQSLPFGLTGFRRNSTAVPFVTRLKGRGWGCGGNIHLEVVTLFQISESWSPRFIWGFLTYDSIVGGNEHP